MGVLERVSATKVSRAFGTTQALRQVSVELRPGQLMVIAGPNGSGKSTLLAILGGRLKPSSGSVDYVGLSDADVSLRRVLGWVSHEALCYPDLSARDNVALAARAHGLDPTQAVDQAVSRFALGDFSSRPLRTYSRGQKQRTALARALVHRPSLLLLDEPTTGLDRDGVALLMEVLRHELGRGAIAAVVTHEEALFGELPQATLQMDRGRGQMERDV